MKSYREDEGADTLNDVGTVVRLDDDVEVHDDSLVVLVVAGPSHLLHTATHCLILGMCSYMIRCLAMPINQKNKDKLFNVYRHLLHVTYTISNTI